MQGMQFKTTKCSAYNSTNTLNTIYKLITHTIHIQFKYNLNEAIILQHQRTLDPLEHSVHQTGYYPTYVLSTFPLIYFIEVIKHLNLASTYLPSTT